MIKIILTYVVLLLAVFTYEMCLGGEEITSWVSQPSWGPKVLWAVAGWFNKLVGIDEVCTRRPKKGAFIYPWIVTVIVVIVRLLAIPIESSGKKFVIIFFGGLLFLVMLALMVNTMFRFCSPTKGGDCLFEFGVMTAILLIMKEVAKHIGSAFSTAFKGKYFLVSLLRNGSTILFYVLLAIALIWLIYRVIRYALVVDHEWVKIIVGIVATIALVIFIILAISYVLALKWPTKANSGDSGTTTTATTTTTTTTVATTETPKEEPKADPKKEEKPKEEPKEEVKDEKPVCGPDYGVAENGVTYDYTEYNDRYIVNGKNVTAKTSWNAFGLSRATVVGHDNNLEEILAVAKDMPQVLATYTVDFFTDKEKEKLGIKGKTTTQVIEMLNGKNGGELQATLYEAYKEELSSNRTKLDDITITGPQYSDYLYHVDKDKDGYITPNEVFLCNAKVYRNKTPQVSVKRLINGVWVQVQLLNKNCRYQSNRDIKPDTPKDPSEPELPPPPQKYKKDINDRQPTTVNQPNENPNSEGDNTNTGVGSTVSSQEPGTKPGDAPGSANFENPNDYIEHNQNEIKEQQEQLEKNEETGTPPGSVEPEEKNEETSVGTPPGSVEPEEKVETIFNDGEEASEKPTEKTPSKITVNGGEDINKKGASNGVVTGP